jgi:ribosomal protein S18 acetylase RimI-like enzyme
MQQVFQLSTLLDAIAEIRNLRKGFITNFYLDEEKHGLWIKKGCLFVEKIEDTLFVVKKNEGFWNVFFNSTTFASFQIDLHRFTYANKQLTLMFDIVANNRMITDFSNVFSKEEYNKYTTLVRMSRISLNNETKPSEGVFFANRGQGTEILDILNCYFDRLTEQIPYLEEINKMIDNHEVVVCEKDGKIIGFAIYELSKSTLYLRYWFVHPDYRNMKVGSRVLRQFFYNGKNCKRQQLWVIETNENAIKRYENYGFKAENLYDIVYTNKKIKYNQI